MANGMYYTRGFRSKSEFLEQYNGNQLPEQKSDSSDEALSKTDFLKKIFDENAHYIKEEKWNAMILRYIELHSKQFKEVKEDPFMKGAFSFSAGPHGLEEGIIVLSDVIPKKFVRYVVIHETTMLTWNKNNYAVEDEFNAAKAELSKSDFWEYCMFRLNMHRNSADIITEMKMSVSEDVQKILKQAQLQSGIVIMEKRVAVSFPKTFTKK